MTCPVCRNNPLENILTIDEALWDLGVVGYVGLSELMHASQRLSTLIKTPTGLQVRRLDAIYAYLRGEAATPPGRSYYDLTVWQIIVLLCIMRERARSGLMDLQMTALARRMGHAALRAQGLVERLGVGNEPWTQDGPLWQSLVHAAGRKFVEGTLVELLIVENEWPIDFEDGHSQSLDTWKHFRGFALMYIQRMG